MSSVYQPKRKELANVKVVTSTQFANNRDEFKVVGRVKRGLSSFVVTPDRKSGRVGFVDDTSSLTKRAKNDLVQFFDSPKNTHRIVAYLVVPKTKVRSKTGNRK